MIKQLSSVLYIPIPKIDSSATSSGSFIIGCMDVHFSEYFNVKEACTLMEIVNALKEWENTKQKW